MIEKLLILGHGNKYKDFFPFFVADAGKIDKFRNKIVHWIVMAQNRGQEPFDPKQDIFLAEHPNIFGKKKVFLDGVIKFSHKTEFYEALLSQFNRFLTNPNLPSDPSKTPWPDIFQSKPLYPPPLSHPLNRFHKIP